MAISSLGAHPPMRGSCDQLEASGSIPATQSALNNPPGRSTAASSISGGTRTVIDAMGSSTDSATSVADQNSSNRSEEDASDRSNDRTDEASPDAPLSTFEEPTPALDNDALARLDVAVQEIDRLHQAIAALQQALSAVGVSIPVSVEAIFSSKATMTATSAACSVVEDSSTLDSRPAALSPGQTHHRPPKRLRDPTEEASSSTGAPAASEFFGKRSKASSVSSESLDWGEAAYVSDAGASSDALASYQSSSAFAAEQVPHVLGGAQPQEEDPASALVDIAICAPRKGFPAKQDVLPLPWGLCCPSIMLHVGQYTVALPRWRRTLRVYKRVPVGRPLPDGSFSGWDRAVQSVLGKFAVDGVDSVLVSKLWRCLSEAGDSLADACSALSHGEPGSDSPASSFEAATVRCIPDGSSLGWDSSSVDVKGKLQPWERELSLLFAQSVMAGRITVRKGELARDLRCAVNPARSKEFFEKLVSRKSFNQSLGSSLAARRTKPAEDTGRPVLEEAIVHFMADGKVDAGPPSSSAALLPPPDPRPPPTTSVAQHDFVGYPPPPMWGPRFDHPPPPAHMSWATPQPQVYYLTHGFRHAMPAPPSSSPLYRPPHGGPPSM
jgi:hypothetical protein